MDRLQEVLDELHKREKIPEPIKIKIMLDPEHKEFSEHYALPVEENEEILKLISYRQTGRLWSAIGLFLAY